MSGTVRIDSRLQYHYMPWDQTLTENVWWSESKVITSKLQNRKLELSQKVIEDSH